MGSPRLFLGTLQRGDSGQWGRFLASWCANPAPALLSCAAPVAGLTPSGKRCPQGPASSLAAPFLPGAPLWVRFSQRPGLCCWECSQPGRVTEYRAPNAFESISAPVYLTSESFTRLSLAEPSLRNLLLHHAFLHWQRSLDSKKRKVAIASCVCLRNFQKVKSRNRSFFLWIVVFFWIPSNCYLGRWFTFNSLYLLKLKRRKATGRAQMLASVQLSVPGLWIKPPFR